MSCSTARPAASSRSSAYTPTASASPIWRRDFAGSFARSRRSRARAYRSSFTPDGAPTASPGSSIAGITVTETGQTLLDAWVWTATAADGSPIGGDVDCHSWTTSSALFKGRVGRSGVDKQDVVEWQQWQSKKQWTSYFTIGCYFKSHIYCLEE